MFNNTHARYDTVSNIFRPYLRDLQLKFLDLLKMLFFLNGSEFGQKLIGTKNLFSLIML